MAITRNDLEGMYSQIEKPIYNFALRWTWNPALAEELVHDAFVRIWRRRHAVEAATLKGLLYKTVQNLALNERRKARIREAFPVLNLFVEDSSADLEHDLIQREKLAELQAALDSLPIELRETLLMCQFSDMSYEEIGSALNIPAGTVGSRKTRALQALKQKMKGAESHGEKSHEP